MPETSSPNESRPSVDEKDFGELGVQDPDAQPVPLRAGKQSGFSNPAKIISLGEGSTVLEPSNGTSTDVAKLTIQLNDSGLTSSVGYFSS